MVSLHKLNADLRKLKEQGYELYERNGAKIQPKTSIEPQLFLKYSISTETQIKMCGIFIASD